MKKIIIIGCPGSGKSTFARSLAEITGLPLHYLDMMYWNPDKSTVSKAQFREKLQSVMETDAWIIDGNYGSTMEMRLAACDTVFFLDFPTDVCLEGIRSRKGKTRPDMPWVEDPDRDDEEFLAYIRGYNEEQRPKVLALLQGYGGKTVHIFKNRTQSDKYLSVLRKEVSTMAIYELKTNREVCWDTFLIDRSENINLEVHRPVRKNVVMNCDKDWETVGVNYVGMVKVGDTYRMYYRGRDKDFWKTYKNRLCVAESKDGKTFTRCNIGLHEFDGSKDNNLFHSEERPIDNFSVFLDTNPDCPADAKFKALSCLETWHDHEKELGLLYYKSADGITFEKVGLLPVPGVFDSYNVVFWDEVDKEYKMYIRDFHDKNGTRRVTPPKEQDLKDVYRDVRLTRSKDFVTWTTPEEIIFDDGDRFIELYTNQIIKYKRAEKMYIGFPSRYKNRPEPKGNYKYLPDWNGRRTEMNATGSRIGTVFMDTGLIVSRDGLHFNRLDGAYMTAGIQQPDTWYYEDCYLGYDMIETESDYYEGVKELSIYRPEGFNVANTRIVRYTVRMDGFYSWHGSYKGGVITTVPVTFEGNALEINYATSGLGHIRIQICDENGSPIEGYDSDIIWGDMVERNVDFEKPLADLAGKTVRLRIELKDADLYSFKFN